MNTEELLKPRYKVIGYYPKSPFINGEILFVHADRPYNGDNVLTVNTQYYGFESKWVDLKEVEKATTIFRKLFWWEDREPEDMPEWVKTGEKVYRAINWELNVSGTMTCQISINFKLTTINLKVWHHILPSTQEEYEQSLATNS